MVFVDTLKIEFSAREFKSKLLLPYIYLQGILLHILYSVLSLLVRLDGRKVPADSTVELLDFVYTEDIPLLVSNVG